MAEETIIQSGRPGDIVPGSTIGPYRIERQLGRGGMATVYEATHLTLERVVALKVLLPVLSGDTEFVDRFLAEARAAARLDYPHIVPIYDSGEIGGIYYIAMKLLEGRDLKALLEERRAEDTPVLPLERAISIGSQVAGALEYAHQHHLVHRDIKPANINVDQQDRVTVVDFGIARALDRASATLTGTVIGTPIYMSPEQAQGKPADNRSDLYSLGIVMYEMLTGRPPFTGNPQTVMYAHVYTEPAPPDSFNGALPPGVAEVVLRMLAKDPDERFQSAGAVALALTNAAGGQLAQNALRTSNDLSGLSDMLPTGDYSTGAYSGPHAAMAGGITHGTLAQPALRKTAAGLPLAMLAATGAAAAAVVIGVLLLLFLVGPLAGPGTLRVDSDPPGATVTVDGNKLGVTPLAAQKLSAGTHSLVIDEPTYVQVQRQEHISSRSSDNVNVTLTSMPSSELVTVKQAIVARDVNLNAAGQISVGTPVSQVSVGQELGLVVTVAQSNPAVRDVTFSYEIALFDSSGNRLTGSPPAQATIKKGDTNGTSLAYHFTFNPNSDGTVPVGTYQLKFLVDNKELASKPIQLVD